MRRPIVRKVVPLALGATVLTGTGFAWAQSGGSGPHYRTTTVELGDVTAVVTATGMVSGLDTGSAAFGISGVVEQVQVSPGDTVEAGDVLATMDTSALDAAVTAAEATLAKAKADLADAENALADAHDAEDEESVESDASAGSGSNSASGSEPGGAQQGGGQQGGGQQGGGSTPGQTKDIDLTAPTQALNAARTTANVALDASTAALAAQQTACADVFASSAPEPSPTPSPTSTPEGSVEESADPTDALKACSDALATVAAAQQQVAAAQAAVITAEAAYRAAMDQALAAAKARALASEEATELAQAAAETAKKQLAALQQQEQQQNSGGQAPGTRGDGTLGGSVLDLAAQVTVADAAVRVAEVELEAAEDDVDAAVLTAPIGGTVAEVPFTQGKSASADEAISILGDGAMQVELSVPSATASTLEKGMTAAVTSDGAEGPSDATVTAIGILPSTSTGTPSYPVMITVPNPSKGLAVGAAAAVTIILRSVQDVDTVPNSAIRATGNGPTASVLLFKDGQAVRQMVTTGAVGEVTTEIADGLTVGQVIVLADPSAAVPTSSTTSTRTGGLGGGAVTFGGGTSGGGGGFAGGAGGRRGG